LTAVDGADLRQKLGISVFIETAPAAKLLVTAVRVSFCFFYDACSKNTAGIVLEILFIEYFTILVETL